MYQFHIYLVVITLSPQCCCHPSTYHQCCQYVCYVFTASSGVVLFVEGHFHLIDLPPYLPYPPPQLGHLQPPPRPPSLVWDG